MKAVFVRDITRDSVLGDQIEIAATSASRRKGLLGRSGLMPGQGLWISDCPAVHSFFMKFAIDLVYVDRHRRVRKLVRNFVPWRMSMCIGAKSVIELPSGTIDRIRPEIGDQLQIGLHPH